MKLSKIFRWIRRKEKCGTLRVHLIKINSNSYKELEDKFSSFKGITCPGLDVRTKVFAVFYIPEIISKEKILFTLKKMGYKWKKVEDIPEEMTCWFGLFSFKIG